MIDDDKNPIVIYLKEHVRKHEGLPFWALAMGVEGVFEQMGWIPPKDIGERTITWFGGTVKQRVQTAYCFLWAAWKMVFSGKAKIIVTFKNFQA